MPRPTWIGSAPNVNGINIDQGEYIAPSVTGSKITIPKQVQTKAGFKTLSPARHGFTLGNRWPISSLNVPIYG